MGIAAQIASLTAIGIRHIPERPGNSLVIAVGIAGVVAVLIPVFTMYAQFTATIKGDGRPDRAIVLSREADTEGDSDLSPDSVAIVLDAPGVRRGRDGNQPMASAEVILAAPVSRKRDHSDVDVTLRGVGDRFFAIRPELKLLAGRFFRPGTQELVVGSDAYTQFEGLGLGKQVRLQNGDWTVVGLFAGGGGGHGSELVADAQTVRAAYRIGSFNSVSVLLESPQRLSAFRQALNQDTRLSVAILGEPEYLASAAVSGNPLLRLVTYAVGSIMALGALFAALNATFSAVEIRALEMATLRAIGFGGTAIAVAVLAEALLLALLGAALGAGIAYTLFNGKVISTVGGAMSGSQLVYALNIAPRVVAGAMLIACVLGMIGGLLPAIRTARASVADSLHEK